MRERERDSSQRRNTVRLWISRDRLSNSHTRRQHTALDRFHFYGWNAWSSSHNFRDPLFSYRIIAIFISFSGVIFGIWQARHGG